MKLRLFGYFVNYFFIIISIHTIIFSMTLATHAITGAAIASLIPEHPVLGFCAGFASHFVLDAIPHWDYHIFSESVNPEVGGSFKINKTLLIDALRIGTDAAVGIIIGLLIFGYPHLIIPALIGALAGVIPDFLQFVYLRFPHPPISWLQNLHFWIHTKIRFKGHGVIGMSTQVLFVALVIGIFKFIL